MMLNNTVRSNVARLPRITSLRLASEETELGIRRIVGRERSRTLAWPPSYSLIIRGVGTVREHPVRVDPGRVLPFGYLFIDDHPAAQLRLILPRRRSSTISSNILSTPPLFCCRNRRHFMHRPPKILFREKLRQPVCRLTLPTIVRFPPYL